MGNLIRIIPLTLVVLGVLAFSAVTAQSPSLVQWADSLERLHQAGDFKKAIVLGEQVIDPKPEDTLTNSYAHILLNLGTSYANLESFFWAAHYNLRALTVYQALQDSAGMQGSALNLCGVYYNLKDSAQAFAYHKKAAQYQPANDSVAPAKMAYTKVLLLLEFGEQEQGLALMDSLLTYFKTANPSLYLSLGVAGLKNLKDATFLKRYSNLLAQAQGKIKGNDARLHTCLEIGLNAHRLGFTYLVDSMYNQAQGRWRKIDTNKITLAERARFYKLKSLASFAKSQYKEAYHALAQYTTLRRKADSLAGKQKREKAEVLLKIKTEQLKNEALAKELSKSNYKLIITLAIVVVLLALSALVFKYQRIAKRQSEAQARIASARGQMISILSHDIKAPLSQIKGVLDAFKRGDLNTGELNGIAPQLMEETDKTMRLLESIVGWINLTREDLQPQINPVYLPNLIKEVRDLSWQQITAKNVQVKTHLEVDTLHSDSFLLETILRNLLSNAIKFTPKGGEICIQSQQQETELSITVKDSGIGMDAQTLENLRNRVLNSKPGTELERGNGLGLIIVARALDKLGGHLEIESTPDQGSSFTVIFK